MFIFMLPSNINTFANISGCSVVLTRIFVISMLIHSVRDFLTNHTLKKTIFQKTKLFPLYFYETLKLSF